MNSSCGSRAKGGMARSTFLRFDFFSSLDIISFLTCNAKGEKNKTEESKNKSKQGAQERVEKERKIGHSRKWTNAREVLRCLVVVFGHERILSLFLVRDKGRGKGSVFIWDSDDIMAPTHHVFWCHMSHVIRLLAPVTLHLLTSRYASFWLTAAV